MEFYALVLIILLFLFSIGYRYPSIKKIIGLMLLAILVLIGGFRDKVGSDYILYTNWYIKGTRDDSFEIGFLTIMKVFRCLNLDYKFLFFFFYLFVCLSGN